jgi:hypothetical protein
MVDCTIMLSAPRAVNWFSPPTATGPATQFDEKLCRKSYQLMREFFAETL